MTKIEEIDKESGGGGGEGLDRERSGKMRKETGGGRERGREEEMG